MTFKKVYIGLIVAVSLGVLMVILPARERVSDVVEPQVLAQAQQELEDIVEPLELADWIIQGRRDFVLVDIRDEQQYGKASIQGAQNMPQEKLMLPGGFDSFSMDKAIVLYGADRGQAAGVSVLLKRAGYRVYVVRGGFARWQQEVLNPVAPAGEVTQEQVWAYNGRVAIKNYFSGVTAAGSGADAALVASKPKAGGPKPAGKKKKLGGC